MSGFSSSLRQVVGRMEPLRTLAFVDRQLVHSVPDDNILLRCATVSTCRLNPYVTGTYVTLKINRYGLLQRDCLTRWLFLGLNRCSNDFITQKCISCSSCKFTLAKECKRHLFSPGFLASYWPAGFRTFLQVSILASHWLKDCVN